LDEVMAFVCLHIDSCVGQSVGRALSGTIQVDTHDLGNDSRSQATILL
jgi:hypothetical protein